MAYPPDPIETRGTNPTVKRGALDSAHLSGINGIPTPEGLTVGDEFDLNVRVRIYELRRDKIDVSDMGRRQYLDGELHANLFVVEPLPALAEVLPACRRWGSHAMDQGRCLTCGKTEEEIKRGL